MKTSPTMQKVILAIAHKHAIDLTRTEAYMRLEQDGYDRLVIENIGHNRIAVAHYYTQNGDAIKDPEIVFFVGYETWVAIEVTQVLTGISELARLNEDSTAVTHLAARRQADTGAFAETWAKNITGQKWLEQGRLTNHNTGYRHGESDTDAAEQSDPAA